MPKVILTYDIKTTTSTIHTELKNYLKKNYNYSDKIQADSGKLYELPNTTLRKDGTTSEQVSADFIAACKAVGATWERYIATEYLKSTFNNQ